MSRETVVCLLWMPHSARCAISSSCVSMSYFLINSRIFSCRLLFNLFSPYPLIAKRLQVILNECSVSVDYAGIVVVLKTLPGLADAAGAAIDAMRLPQMLGCISGNDSVAVIARGESEARTLRNELSQYCK